MIAITLPHFWHHIGNNGLPHDNLIIKDKDNNIIVWTTEGEVIKVNQLSDAIYISTERSFNYVR